MHVTPFAISGLLAGVFSLGFGILVLSKSPNKPLGRIWFLFSLSVAVWGFGALWIGLASTPDSALLAWRFAYGFGVVWIPTLFFQFVCIFCGLERPKLIFSHYLISIVYFLIMPTDYFFSTPRLMFGSLYFPGYQWPYKLFTAWWIAFVLYSHVQLWRAYRKENTAKKIQIKYFFMSTAIGYCGGSLVYLPNFGVEFYPWGNFAVFLYPIIMAYAIVRFNLMDIRLLMRRTALVLGVYLILLAAAAPVVYFFQAHGHQLSSSLLKSLEILFVSAVLSTGPFLYAYAVRKNAYFQVHTLAGLTHELKSPLTVIENALEFLSNQPNIESMGKDQLSDYLQMIQRNSTRLQKNVNELLQAFHPKEADVSLSIEKTHFPSLINEVIESYRARFPRERFSVLIEESPSMTLPMDAVKINQALSNILSNAVKFGNGNLILVSAKKIRNEIQVEVHDRGAGIPAQELPYVFDRFFQGDLGRKKKGSGVGLTIAKTWIEANGGKIWVESDGEGKGATVTFTLPVAS